MDVKQGEQEPRGGWEAELEPLWVLRLPRETPAPTRGAPHPGAGHTWPKGGRGCSKGPQGWRSCSATPGSRRWATAGVQGQPSPKCKEQECSFRPVRALTHIFTVSQVSYASKVKSDHHGEDCLFTEACPKLRIITYAINLGTYTCNELSHPHSRQLCRMTY